MKHWESRPSWTVHRLDANVQHTFNDDGSVTSISEAFCVCGWCCTYELTLDYNAYRARGDEDFTRTLNIHNDLGYCAEQDHPIATHEREYRRQRIMHYSVHETWNYNWRASAHTALRMARTKQLWDLRNGIVVHNDHNDTYFNDGNPDLPYDVRIVIFDDYDYDPFGWDFCDCNEKKGEIKPCGFEEDWQGDVVRDCAEGASRSHHKANPDTCRHRCAIIRKAERGDLMAYGYEAQILNEHNDWETVDSNWGIEADTSQELIDYLIDAKEMLLKEHAKRITEAVEFIIRATEIGTEVS